MKRFRQTGPGGQQTDNVFGRLVTTLTNARIATENNALYQTIYGLIKLTTKLDDDTRSSIKTIVDSLPSGGGGGGGPIGPVAPADQTYLTQTNETATLPNSLQLVAGSGITLTQAGITLEVATDIEPTLDYVVLSDGYPPDPQAMSDGAGSFIYIPYNA